LALLCGRLVAPDFGAVGQYALLFGREMANTGMTVSLIGLTAGTGKTNRKLSSGVL